MIHIYSDPSFSNWQKAFLSPASAGAFFSIISIHEPEPGSIRHSNLSGILQAKLEQVIDELPSFAILHHLLPPVPHWFRDPSASDASPSSRRHATSDVWGFATLAGGLFGSPRSDHPGDDVKRIIVSPPFTLFHKRNCSFMLFKHPKQKK